MIYFNIIITLLAVWLCLFIYDSFIRPALEVGKQYRLNVLRDRVELITIRNDILLEKKCCRMLIEIMDESINALTDFRLSRFLEFLIKYDRYRSELKELFGSTNSNTEQLKVISEEFFKEMGVIINRETKSYEKLILPVILFMCRMLGKSNSHMYNFFARQSIILAKVKQWN